MSIEAMVHVWKHSKHSGTDLLVLLAIADSANDNWEAYPVVKTIAKKCRASERTVQRTITRLCEGDGEQDIDPELDRVIGGGLFSRFGSSNLYRVLGRPVEEEEGEKEEAVTGRRLTGDKSDTTIHLTGDKNDTRILTYNKNKNYSKKNNSREPSATALFPPSEEEEDQPSVKPFNPYAYYLSLHKEAFGDYPVLTQRGNTIAATCAKRLHARVGHADFCAVVDHWFQSPYWRTQGCSIAALERKLPEVMAAMRAGVPYAPLVRGNGNGQQQQSSSVVHHNAQTIKAPEGWGDEEE